MEHAQFFRRVTVKNLPARRMLSNFSARVAEDIIRDDGADEQRFFALEGRMPIGDQLKPLPRREVPAQQFEGLAWLSKTWGVEPGALPGQKEYVAYAIRLLSGQVPRRTIFTHLGWRKLAGQWAYLHYHLRGCRWEARIADLEARMTTGHPGSNGHAR